MSQSGADGETVKRDNETARVTIAFDVTVPKDSWENYPNKVFNVVDAVRQDVDNPNMSEHEILEMANEGSLTIQVTK